MKIKDITLGQAREICRKNHQNCKICELRRVYKGYLLMCFWIIKDTLTEEEIEEMLNEELTYYGVEKEG